MKITVFSKIGVGVMLMVWEQKETDFCKKGINEGYFWFLKLPIEISDEFQPKFTGRKHGKYLN